MFDPYLARRYPRSGRPRAEAYRIKDKVAIAGIGQTEFSKNSGRSEVQLACEAIQAAVDDAGLQIEDIDGLVKFSIDYTDEMYVASNLGLTDVAYFAECGWGGEPVVQRSFTQPWPWQRGLPNVWSVTVA